MRNVKLLVQDIVENSTNLLSKDIAISVLLDNLRDLGWTEAEAAIAAHQMTFD